MGAKKTQGTELYYLSVDEEIIKVPGATGITGLGGGATKIDATDLDSVEKESIAGLPDPGAASVPLNFDPASEVHQGLVALKNAGSKVTWILGLSDGTAPPTANSSGAITYPTSRTYRSFLAYVADLPVDAAIDSKYTTTMSLQRSGAITDHWKA